MLRADAIVVLGCRILPSGRPGAAAERRLLAAVSAYRRGIAEVVVVSGGRRWGGHIEARVFQRELTRAGVPAHAVIEELCSLSTYENAIFSAAVLRRPDRPRPRAAIVSCPFHLPRALADFRAAGVDAFAFPAPVGPASIGQRAYLRAHEIVSSWFDRRALRHADILTASAELLATPITDSGDRDDARPSHVDSHVEGT